MVELDTFLVLQAFRLPSFVPLSHDPLSPPLLLSVELASIGGAVRRPVRASSNLHTVALGSFHPKAHMTGVKRSM